MNNNHVTGTANEIKGKIKENVGHVTGNEKMESEGILEQVKGKLEKGFGDLKDSVKKGVDHLLEKK